MVHKPQLPSDFSAESYLRLNPDVRAAGVDAETHWLNHGHIEGRRYRVPRAAEKDIQRLRDSSLFDEGFYVSLYPDVTNSGIDPESHYLISGAKEGRWASLMFRTDWYVDRYPDARTDNPLFHFLDVGSRRGYHPNPFFETDYYRSTYRDAINWEEPLKHFILNGHCGLFNPSPRFDAAQYLSDNKIADNVNPLIHYLSFGLAEGISPKRARPAAGKEVLESAWIDRAKYTDDRFGSNALLITHSANGQIKPHVARLAHALNNADYAVHLIIASDARTAVIPPDLLSECKNVFVRENIGFDFGAWAHVLKLLPWIWEGNELLLTNDSVCGPVKTSNLHDITRRIRSSEYRIVGLTGNYEYAHHLQSYYLSLKRDALASPEIRRFFDEIVNLPEKNQVIREYEITLSPRARRAGLSTGALYPPYRERNPTIWDWDKLLDDGFPFIKMALISGEQRELFGSAIIDRLRKERFPVHLVRPDEAVAATEMPKHDLRMFFSKWPAPQGRA